MAVDIFEMLIDILKINQNQVAEYAAQGPLYQLFYLLFFPTIFIVIFVWILSHAIMGGHKALRILLAIGVYAFIILQGLYGWFIMLSKFWLFGLMFLGFIYFITYRGGRGGGGGGGGGAHPKAIGGLNLSFGKVFDQINPLGDYRAEVESLERDINSLWEQVCDSKKLGQPGHYQEMMTRIHGEIDALEKNVPLRNKNPGIVRLKANYAKAIKGNSKDPPKW